MIRNFVKVFFEGTIMGVLKQDEIDREEDR